MSVTLRFAALCIVLTMGALGCKPKVGKKCSPEGKEVCGGKGAALLCLDGKWTPMPCRGAKGCSGEGVAMECDQSVAREQETCHLDGALTCAEDKRSSVVCKNNSWVAAEICGGPEGCQSAGRSATCDSSVARDGDRCTRQGSQACSQDKRARLVCNGGKYTLAEHCRGTDGCKTTGRRVLCDDSLAVIGEPCDVEGNFSCSTDFRNILICHDGKFAVDTRCKSSTSCQVEGTKVGCRE